MSRAIKIFGIGFSDTDNDAEVEIKIDDDVIYSGTVTTDTNTDLNTYLSGSELEETEVVSWVEDDVSSTKSLSITAISGNFLYMETLSTYSGEETLDNPELFAVHFYSEEDGDIVADPNSNVRVDGELYEDGAPDDRNELFGQWNIGIPEGSTMTCDLIIDEASVEPESTDESSE